VTIVLRRFAEFAFPLRRRSTLRLFAAELSI
jgi:hypothetical protein